MDPQRYHKPSGEKEHRRQHFENAEKVEGYPQLIQENVSSSSKVTSTSTTFESSAPIQLAGAIESTTHQFARHNLESSAAGNPSLPGRQQESIAIRQDSWNGYGNNESTVQQRPFSEETQAPEHATTTPSISSVTPILNRPDTESSDDSFIYVERLKFYRSKLSEALRTERWKDAEEFQSNIFGILIHQEESVGAEWYITSATISYMLDDLEEANRCLSSIPEAMLVDPTTLLKIYSLESAILIRRKQYDNAFTTCKKAAKLARKSNLTAYMHLAYFFLQTLFTARGNLHEADFYRQLIPPNFGLPIYAKTFESKGKEFSSSLPQSSELLAPATHKFADARTTAQPVAMPVELPADAPWMTTNSQVKERMYPNLAVTPNQTKHRIIVGVDFGTSYSSIAWVSSLKPKRTNIISNWPGAEYREEISVPTELSYHNASINKYDWGWAIPWNQRRLCWFKLLLESNDPEILRKVNMPQGLDVIDVVTHFLSSLYLHILSKVVKQWAEAPQIDFVLTVPALWNESAKQRTLKCAENAGFMRGHNLTSISEPEAAALFCSTVKNLKVNERFVVCDAGGGTVDVVTYDCLEVTPTLKLRQCSEPDGAFAGSSAVDRNFQDYFKDTIGDEDEKLTWQSHQSVIKNFQPIKCDFADQPDRPTYTIKVPAVNNLPKAGIKNSLFTVTRQEMRSFFDPVIRKIINLLYDQIKDAQDSKTKRVDTILLVGGFGESPYLYNQIYEWASPYGIEVFRPPSGITAVVKGAVLVGLEALNRSDEARDQHDTATEDEETTLDEETKVTEAIEATKVVDSPPSKAAKPKRKFNFTNWGINRR
ncbi:hypothetical protein TWF694_006000 [Orbilia ellipsospora]|uniref:Uncharacterized protein n=1 Tax=Orbilia ellipsospora TaxID=2528407 RepID=A0AAV9WQW6_9PEZI